MGTLSGAVHARTSLPVATRLSSVLVSLPVWALSSLEADEVLFYRAVAGERGLT